MITFLNSFNILSISLLNSVTIGLNRSLSLFHSFRRILSVFLIGSGFSVSSFYLYFFAGNLLQFSCLENAMDRGAWWAIVHEVGRKESDTTEHAGT